MIGVLPLVGTDPDALLPGVLNQLIPDLTEDELEMIPELAQGFGIWRIGRSHPRMIRPIAGPMWERAFDTSDLRRAS